MSARFAIVPARAVFDDRLSPSTLRVLNVMGVYGDKNGWCRPSLTTIGKKLNCTKQAVAKHIKSLSEYGYLEIHHRYRKDGGRSSNLYRILFDVGEPENETLEDEPFEDDKVDAQSTDRHSPPVSPRSSPPLSALEVDGILERPNLYERPIGKKENIPPARKRAGSRAHVDRPDDVSEQTWADFLELRKSKRAPLTATALAGIAREADKAGMSLQDAIALCCERGWQSINARWISEKSSGPYTGSAGGNGGGAGDWKEGWWHPVYDTPDEYIRSGWEIGEAERAAKRKQWEK